MLAAAIHPVYNRLSPAARKLIARDVQQVLGNTLTQPVSFVVCWTSDGAETIEQYGRETGGTGVAIALASSFNIPVFNWFNVGRYDDAMGTLTSVTTVV